VRDNDMTRLLGTSSVCWMRRVVASGLRHRSDVTDVMMRDKFEGIYSSSVKMVSMGLLKRRASLKASGRLGSNLPVSMAFTDCRETSSRSARSA